MLRLSSFLFSLLLQGIFTMTTAKKAIVANYTQDAISTIVNDYNLGRQKGQDNAAILAELSAKYGRTIPSIRAKLASLKVYVKDTETSESSSVKATKRHYVSVLENLTGLPLESLETATKSQLQDLVLYIDDLKATIHDLKARI
jgi:hypothetical protein